MAGSRLSARAIVRRVHLWTGLTLGLLFALAGVTGSVLAFYPELDNSLHPELRQVAADARPASWQAVYDALRRDHPERQGAWRIEVTQTGGAVAVRYYNPPETRGQAFAPLMIWLDPGSLATIREGFWGSYPTTWIYALHWQLLSGTTGEVVMGIAGIAMLVLLLSGLWIWWPRSGQWRRALRFKPQAGRSRRLYDIHKLAGLIGLPVLLVVTATGVLLELPRQVRPIIARASPLFAMPDMSVTPTATGMLPLDTLVARGTGIFPGAQLAWIETPRDATAPVRINLAQAGEPSRRFPRTNVWLDPYTGRILAVRDAMRDGGGDTMLNWLHPLHSGEAFGLAGRILVLLSGFVAAALAFTGWLRWATRP